MNKAVSEAEQQKPVATPARAEAAVPTASPKPTVAWRNLLPFLGRNLCDVFRTLVETSRATLQVLQPLASSPPIAISVPPSAFATYAATTPAARL